MSTLAALVRRYERMADTGGAPVPGYSTEKISFAIIIDENGGFRDAQPLGEMVKGKRMAAIMTVPQPTKRTVGIAANLFWDKTAYALGATNPEKESKRAAKKGMKPGEAEFSAFKSRQHDAIGDTDDPGLQAFLKFLDRWNPALYFTLGLPEDMVDANVIFRLDGLNQEYLHDRSAARAIVAHSLARADAA